MTHPPNSDHDLRDLVRGLRTAASTVESIDFYVSTSAARADMLHTVEQDLARLSYLLVAARAESQAA